MIDRKWQARFMRLAREVSEWSKDPSTKVVAVLVAPDGKNLIALGFNGFAAGVDDTPARLADRAVKYPLTIHAEVNAILRAGHQARGAHMVCTHAPCAACASVMRAAGVVSVSYPSGGVLPHWGESHDLAMMALRESGLRTVVIE